jgi:hypothetical protein
MLGAKGLHTCFCRSFQKGDPGAPLFRALSSIPFKLASSESRKTALIPLTAEGTM